MSKKPASAESNDSDTVNDDSECSAQRAKPDPPPIATMLQNLPIELLQHILVKAIALEVKDLKLAKCVWKEKADLVIRRLRTVSSQWNDCLATNSFRNELYRTLDGTAQQSIRLNVVQESLIRSKILALTTLNDKIFTLGVLLDREYCVTIYDRNSQVTDVIPLGIGYGVMGPYPFRVTGCNLANCVYLGMKHPFGDMILRISKTAEQKFDVDPVWEITDHRHIDVISTSDNGSLLVLSKKRRDETNPVSVHAYDTNRSLQREINITIDNGAHKFKSVLEKSNENLVVAYIRKENRQLNLLEIDRSGGVVHRHESSRKEGSVVTFADSVGRIMISEMINGIDLLDFELNLLGVYSLQQDEGRNRRLNEVYYDRERNEVVRVHGEQGSKTNGLTFFRFTEE